MKEQNNRKASLYVLKRLLSYMIKNYRFSFLAVVVCIIIGAFATMQGMLFVQSLVDDYIVPLLNAEDPDFTPLARALAGIVIFYLIGGNCSARASRRSSTRSSRWRPRWSP